MSKSLPEIFKEMSFAPYEGLLQKGKLEQVLVNAEKRSVVLKFAFSELCDRALLLNMQNDIKRTYRLNEVSAQLYFSGVALDDAYYQGLKPLLYTMLPASESLLSDSYAEFQGGRLLVRAGNGCELFNSERYLTAISELILNELGQNVSVHFESTKTFDAEAFIKQQAEAEKEAVRKMQEESAPKSAEAVLYGKEIPEKVEPISSISEASGRVAFMGRVFFIETRELRGGRKLLKFDVTDYTGSMTVKMLDRTEAVERIEEKVKKGMVLRIRGSAQYDKYERELIVMLDDMMKIEDPWVTSDDAPEKRVELHVHSKMSAMDGVSEIKDIIARAAAWGHKAIAVTDHGVVQAFPDAMDAGKKHGIKILYGVECYIVDEDAAPAVSA